LLQVVVVVLVDQVQILLRMELVAVVRLEEAEQVHHFILVLMVQVRQVGLVLTKGQLKMVGLELQAEVGQGQGGVLVVLMQEIMAVVVVVGVVLVGVMVVLVGVVQEDLVL
jgi:hypothetical protein